MDMRPQIDALLECGEVQRAHQVAADAWKARPSASTAACLNSLAPRFRGKVPLRRCRLAVLRSFTLEPVVPLASAGALAAGIDLTVQLGEFNAYTQEILDPRSALYEFAPDVVLLALLTRDAAPDLWAGFSDLSADQVRESVERVTAHFRSLIEAFRRHSAAPLILHSLETPSGLGQGIYDSQAECSQAEAVAAVNRNLRSLCRHYNSVYLLDYDALIARAGRAGWGDETKWLTVRLPISASNLTALAGEWLRYLHPLTGRIAKVAVTDLDNTLWGGIVGEDGPDGIRLGPEYPGAGHLALQRALLDLSRRGILLAVASRNNPEDAMSVLESHPAMLLRPASFASLRINWNDKAASLREIAGELNVGLDSLVLLDDNPVEREHVRRELAEVAILDLPADPMGYAGAVRDCPLFERLSVSSEDRQRTRYYAAQRGREERARQAGSVEEFFRSLDQVVEVVPAVGDNLVRIAQLTQKTNQFNLTTQRYSEEQIAGFAASADFGVWPVRVRDRFGDNGIVGVCIAAIKGDVCEIDTFLLSCRVIGRTVETALLAFTAAQAQRRGARRLSGRFIPTKKNAPAADFFSRHGFRQDGQVEGCTLWTLDLAESRPDCPPWIQLVAAKELIPSERAF